MTGYRGFESKLAYETHYSDINNYKDELQSMSNYTKECEEEAKMINPKPIQYLGDMVARKGVEIDIRQDGLVIWINVDGVCISRIITNGMIDITVTDNRK